MDKSLSNFELNESTIKMSSDSENGSSDKSDTLDFITYSGDTDQSSNNISEQPNLEDFDNNLPETVTLLRHTPTNANVYLVGTAHFSKESQEDVEKVIKNVVPNVVVLELCTSRMNILLWDEKAVLEEAKRINFQKIITNIRNGGLYNGIMYLLLLNMSANITKQIGMAPGGEFRVAYKEATKIQNCQISLSDRPINITLKRALSRLSWIQTIKLAWHLLTSNDSVSVEDIEKCKKRDMLEQLLADLAGEYPAFREVFLEERDIYLTHSIKSIAISKAKKDKDNEGEPLKIVVVVGIGHVPGIIKIWSNDQRPLIANILTIPPPSLSSQIIKYTFKISLLACGGYLVYRYVPVPKSFKTNVGTFFQKFLS